MTLGDLDPADWGAFIQAWRAWAMARDRDPGAEFEKTVKSLRRTVEYGDRSDDDILRKIVEVFIDTLRD